MVAHGRLLVNWVTYSAVGHAIEALRIANQLHIANPDLSISVVMHDRGGVELAECLPWIDAVYGVDPELCTSPTGAREALGRLPRHWDYCFTDPRQDHPMGDDALDASARALERHLVAGSHNRTGLPSSDFPEMRLAPLRLQLPSWARASAREVSSDDAVVRVSLLLGSGGGGARTPPLAFWHALLDELAAVFPSLEVLLLGALKRDRSVTFGVSRADVDELLAAHPYVRDGFDTGLLHQLALAERCHVHISPHSGMSFAVQCVGTPWVALSGGNTMEYLSNGVPFVSIYPRCPLYPCGEWFAPDINPMLPECEERMMNNAPFQCLEASALEAQLPRIIEAAKSLVAGGRRYSDHIQAHYEEMLPRLGRQQGDLVIQDQPAVLTDDYDFERW